MEKIERITLEIERYTDDKGQKTCSLNIPLKQYCIFLKVGKFGTIEVCSFNEEEEKLQRRDNGVGTIIPCKNCRLWNESNIVKIVKEKQ